MTIFVTANIDDGTIQKKAYEVAKICLGVQMKKFDKIEVLDFSNDVKIPIRLKINLEMYVGYYAQTEIEIVHEIFLKNSNLFMNIKNLGEIQFIMKDNHEFKILGTIDGKFLVENGIVVGMNFINLPR